MADLHLAAALNIDSAEQTIESLFAIKAIPVFKIVMKNFVSNMGRPLQLIRLQSHIAAHASAWQFCLDQAALERWKTLEPTKEEFVSGQESIKERAQQLMGDTHKSPQMLEWGAYQAENIAISQGALGGMAIESLFHTALVQYWTAFETFATDLWVAAVDLIPELASRSAEANSSKNVQQGKSLTINQIAEFRFDLRGTMGTLMRKAKKVDFDTLDGIEKAYNAAFEKPINKVFSSDKYTDMKYLSVVRNAIVHRGGVADTKFRDDTNGCRHFVGLQDGDKIWVDGKVVADFGGSAVGCCVELLKFVNDYAIANPSNYK